MLNTLQNKFRPRFKIFFTNCPECPLERADEIRLMVNILYLIECLYLIKKYLKRLSAFFTMRNIEILPHGCDSFLSHFNFLCVSGSDDCYEYFQIGEVHRFN